jgi:hypothetical protein
LAAELAEIAASKGMRLLSCCEDALARGGVGKSRCIDPDAIGRAMGFSIGSIPARPTRKDCGCVQSVDIGAYDTCAFGCAYCYAVGSRDRALRRIREGNENDSILYRPASLQGVKLESIELERASLRG